MCVEFRPQENPDACHLCIYEAERVGLNYLAKASCLPVFVYSPELYEAGVADKGYEGVCGILLQERLAEEGGD